MLARRGAVHHALGDALADGGDAKQVVGHVVVPDGRVDALAAGALEVQRHVFLFGRDAELLERQPLDAAEFTGRNVPAHAVVGEIGERVAQRRELPVEHREHPRLGRMEHRVVEAVVAVHDGGFVGGRNILRQPGDHVVHRLDLHGLRGDVLLAPAPDLALDVAAGLAEIRKADFLVVHAVQQRDDAVELFPDGFPLRLCHSRQRLVPQYAPVDAIHEIEGGADHRIVFAEYIGLRYRKSYRVQCLDHLELAIHCVRGGQQLAGRLAAQRVALAARGDAVSGVRLAALELLDLERSAESLHLVLQEILQAPGVDAMAFFNGLYADELVGHGSGNPKLKRYNWT